MRRSSRSVLRRLRPRLFGIKVGDTDYKICALPFGGYVKMTGEIDSTVTGAREDDNPAHVHDPGSFTAHPRWQRMLIGLAGPVSNFILAFVAMTFYYNWINEIPDIRTSTLAWITPGSVADQAGLKAGDVIQRLGTFENPDLETVVDSIRKSPNQTLPVRVLRGGQPVQLSLHLPNNTDSSSFELGQTGLFFNYASGPIGVDQTVPDAPAERAGLRAGDQILAVDGHAFQTVDPLLDYLQLGKGRPVTLTVKRDGVILPPVIANPYQQESQWRLGFMAVAPADPPMRRKPLSLSAAASEARDFCAENSLLIVNVLHKLFTRQTSVKQLAGPVGIAHAAGQAAEMKYWWPKFTLAAGISLNLGILNLMPFPILDGGLILLLLIESVLRHDISIVIKERIYQAAFVVLVMFFVYVSFNDVAKLSVFSHIKP